MAMHADLHGLSYNPHFANPRLAYQPAVVETTDRFGPSQSWRELNSNEWAQVLVPTSVAVQSPFATTGNEQAATADMRWFRGALESLTRLHNATDDPAILRKLPLAEVLIGHFAVWPESRRPDISEDVYGNPHFSAKGDNYYLHISIEDDLSLNWYAKFFGDDIFEDQYFITDGKLSKKLSSIANM